MRPVQKGLNAAGAGPWIPVAYNQPTFNLSLAGFPSSGASLTYKAQHTFDEMDLERVVLITQSTTTVTVTDSGPTGLGHGLSVGDDVILKGTAQGGAPASVDGDYAVASVVSLTQYTVTVPTSQTIATAIRARVTTLKVVDNATMVGQTGRSSSNYAFPVTAVRANITAYASGFLSFILLQGLGT